MIGRRNGESGGERRASFGALRGLALIGALGLGGAAIYDVVSDYESGPVTTQTEFGEETRSGFAGVVNVYTYEDASGDKTQGLGLATEGLEALGYAAVTAVVAAGVIKRN